MQKTLYVAMLAVVALAACEKRLDQSKTTVPGHLAATGTSGNVVGTSPAPPTAPEGTETTPVDPHKPLKETAQTTSSAEDSKEISKGEESKAMPLPGQANDHSTVASDASQKAGQKDPQQTPERTDEPSPPQRDNASK